MSFIVIARYIPTRWRLWKVGRDLCEITRLFGLIPLPLGMHRLHKAKWVRASLHADILRRAPVHDTIDLDWHRDGDITGANMNCGIVLWSNICPTQIRPCSNGSEPHVLGEIVQPQPFEVVLFNNLDVVHRRPPNAPQKRWLFRQRVQP